MKSQDLKKTKLPDAPGVYLFKRGREVLYVGKATSLRDRVKSYFAKDLIVTRGPLLVDMVFQATKLDHLKTPSVLEAIISEAELIKKHQPRYNTKEKSDKSFNYVVITDEDFPRVLIERQRNLAAMPNIRFRFGPFTNGEVLKNILKILRKIFPFRDRCEPCVNNLTTAKLFTHRACRPCFNRQLGLCPGVCDGTISKKDYAAIIRKIRLVLSGRIAGLKILLKKEMAGQIKRLEFEKAGETKRQIFALEHIQDVMLIKEEHNLPLTPSLSGGGNGIGRPLIRGLGVFRIEAYDAAHLSGTNNVGVMVVMENGELKRRDYRKFNIRNTKGDDLGALKEILTRRLRHAEWLEPDLIVLDGGMAQLNVAKRTTAPNPSLTKEGKRKIVFVSVVKDARHKAKALIGNEEMIKKYRKEILSVNAEAHRFAVAFHRRKRSAIL